MDHQTAPTAPARGVVIATLLVTPFWAGGLGYIFATLWLGR